MALGNTLLDGIQSEFNKAMDTTSNLVKNDSKAFIQKLKGKIRIANQKSYISC